MRTLSLQRMGDWLTRVMAFFTWLGYPQAYMVLIAIIYWSVDRKFGLRLAIFLPVTASINSILKQAIHAPRPYWVDQHVKALRVSNGFGMPSGHAQAATVWIYAASLLKKRWFWIIAVAMVLVIGLSRIYLGVHFPGQVVTGWTIGILIAILFIRFESNIIRGVLRLSLGKQLFLIISISMVQILLGAVFVWLLKRWEFPAEWIRNAADDLAGRNETILSSIGLHSVAGNAGGFMGAGMGAVLSRRMGGFEVWGRWWSRVLRCLTGLTVLALLYGAFSLITPQKTQGMLYSLWEFSGFFCISISAIFLIPYLLLRIKLLSK
jgi:membrane-associated phospholipid phosphatase